MRGLVGVEVGPDPSATVARVPKLVDVHAPLHLADGRRQPRQLHPDTNLLPTLADKL